MCSMMPWDQFHQCSSHSKSAISTVSIVETWQSFMNRQPTSLIRHIKTDWACYTIITLKAIAYLVFLKLPRWIDTCWCAWVIERRLQIGLNRDWDAHTANCASPNVPLRLIRQDVTFICMCWYGLKQETLTCSTKAPQSLSLFWRPTFCKIKSSKH